MHTNNDPTGDLGALLGWPKLLFRDSGWD